MADEIRTIAHQLYGAESSPKPGAALMHAVLGAKVPTAFLSQEELENYFFAFRYGTRVEARPGSSKGKTWTKLAEPFRVRVTTNSQPPQPVKGFPVALSVVAGEGTLESEEVTTNADGVAVFDLWTLGKPGRNVLRAQVGEFVHDFEVEVER